MKHWCVSLMLFFLRWESKDQRLSDASEIALCSLVKFLSFCLKHFFSFANLGERLSCASLRLSTRMMQRPGKHSTSVQPRVCMEAGGMQSRWDGSLNHKIFASPAHRCQCASASYRQFNTFMVPITQLAQLRVFFPVNLAWNKPNIQRIHFRLLRSGCTFLVQMNPGRITDFFTLELFVFK